MTDHIREAIDAINRALGDGLPQESDRLLLRAITLTREADRIARVAFENGYTVKMVGGGAAGETAFQYSPDDEDTLPPPDEKTEPMAAPFAITATGALKR